MFLFDSPAGEKSLLVVSSLQTLGGFVSQPAEIWRDARRYLTWLMPKYLEYSNRQAGRETDSPRALLGGKTQRFIMRRTHKSPFFVAHVFYILSNYHPNVVIIPSVTTLADLNWSVMKQQTELKHTSKIIVLTEQTMIITCKVRGETDTCLADDGAECRSDKI